MDIIAHAGRPPPWNLGPRHGARGQDFNKRPFLEPLAGTQLREAAHCALKKIRATLSEAALEYLDQFRRLFRTTVHGFGDDKAKADIIDTLDGDWHAANLR